MTQRVIRSGSRTVARRSPLPRDAVLTSREVARVLDATPDEVNELARKRRLAGFKEGRLWRFRACDVLEFQEAERASSDASPAELPLGDAPPEGASR